MGTEVRNAFVAEGRSVLVGCDYSQIEMRVLARFRAMKRSKGFSGRRRRAYIGCIARVWRKKPEG